MLSTRSTENDRIDRRKSRMIMGSMRIKKPMPGQGQTGNSYANGGFCLLSGRRPRPVRDTGIGGTFRGEMNLLWAVNTVYSAQCTVRSTQCTDRSPQNAVIPAKAGILNDTKAVSDIRLSTSPFKIPDQVRDDVMHRSATCELRTANCALKPSPVSVPLFIPPATPRWG